METDFWQLFLKGGFFMWPLLVLSSLSIIIIIERIVFFCTHSYRFTPTLESDRNEESFIAGNNPLLRVISEYKKDISQGEEHCLNLGTREASRQLIQHERGVKMLATIGAISPLIGLLGTVWGMVMAFASMAKLGESVTASDFAQGIWTGLLTTVAGLIVAIPAVTASRLLESKIDRLSHDLNELASHLKERYFPTN